MRCAPVGSLCRYAAPSAGRGERARRASQAVNYGAATPGGELGLALGRAEWHRSFVTGQLITIPLVVAPLDNPVCAVGVPPPWW